MRRKIQSCQLENIKYKKEITKGKPTKKSGKMKKKKKSVR